jgi:hypothetical protein
MGNQSSVNDGMPEFDIALWGYEREQVDHCLRDLTGRLEDALGRLDSVEVLHQQLCEARVELDQLQRSMEEQPHWSYQVAELLQTAEALRSEAEAAAAGGRAGRADQPRGSMPSAE